MTTEPLPHHYAFSNETPSKRLWDEDDMRFYGEACVRQARLDQVRAKIAALAEGDGPVSNETARAYLATYPSDAGFCPASLEAALRWGHRMHAALLSARGGLCTAAVKDGTLAMIDAALAAPTLDEEIARRANDGTLNAAMRPPNVEISHDRERRTDESKP